MTNDNSTAVNRSEPEPDGNESADDDRGSPAVQSGPRRRFLQVASAAGLSALAGCSISFDGSGFSSGDSESDSSGSTPQSTETPEPTATPEETNTPEPTPEATETPEPTPRPPATLYDVDNFEITSHDGDLDVYGSIKMRGIYDEDEYINPRGRNNWEVLVMDEDEAFSLEEGTPQEILVPDSTIKFPAEVVEDFDGREPFIIVRIDLIERREGSNEFLGWDSTRVFLDELQGRTEGQEVTNQFTGGGNDVRVSYTVTPRYD